MSTNEKELTAKLWEAIDSYAVNFADRQLSGICRAKVDEAIALIKTSAIVRIEKLETALRLLASKPDGSKNEPIPARPIGRKIAREALAD